MAKPAEPDVLASTGIGRAPAAEPRAHPATAVVVGVDGCGSRAAIAIAAREARYRGALLIAVQAYSGEHMLEPPAIRSGSPAEHSDEDERADAESRLREVVRDALGELADGVEVRAVLGLAGRKIVETAHKVNAQLIVLTSRGSTSMLLGTVSQYVLRKATCPVLVVPAGMAGP